MPPGGVHRDDERGGGEERLRFLIVLLAGLVLAVALVLERIQSI
jgi:hypothetical protein